MALARVERTSSREMPLLFSESGLSSTRTAGSELPPTVTWPTPATWESFWLNTVEARSYSSPKDKLGEVSPMTIMGESAGFIFR